MKLSNKMYDVLKWITQYFLPCVATLYFALSSIWGFPYGEEIVGTIAAITAFLGGLLGISTAQYEKEVNSELAEMCVMSEEDQINIKPNDVDE